MEGEFVVAFIVDRDFKVNFIDFKPIHKRASALRFKAKFFNIWLANMHAPHCHLMTSIDCSVISTSSLGTLGSYSQFSKLKTNTL